MEGLRRGLAYQWLPQPASSPSLLSSLRGVEPQLESRREGGEDGCSAQRAPEAPGQEPGWGPSSSPQDAAWEWGDGHPHPEAYRTAGALGSRTLGVWDGRELGLLNLLAPPAKGALVLEPDQNCPLLAE